jgi:hypothetical protein
MCNLLEKNLVSAAILALCKIYYDRREPEFPVYSLGHVTCMKKVNKT